MERSSSRGPRPTIHWAAYLCLFTGLSAVGGGTALMWFPQGSRLLPPLHVLEHTPFEDFLLPGLILFNAVGIVNLVAGAMVLRRSHRADAAVFVAGAMLTGWIVIEMAMMRAAYWLHLLYLAIGLATLGIATVRGRFRSGSQAPEQRAETRDGPVLHRHHPPQ